MRNPLITRHLINAPLGGQSSEQLLTRHTQLSLLWQRLLATYVI